MTLKHLLLPLVVLCATETFAGAVQRHIERVMPRGGQRGTTVEIKIQGAELGNIREAIFYRGGVEAVEFSAPKEIAPRSLHHGARFEQEVTCKFRIAADCPLGVHPFRLRTDRELTTVSTFRVTPYPVAQESEAKRGANDQPSQAETIPSGNVTIAGQIQGDPDCFRITRHAGERISVEVDAVWLTEIAYGEAEYDLSVQILDDQGQLLARNDDSMLHVQDPIVSTIAPRNGDYIVRVQQSVPLDSQVNYLAHAGTFVRPLVAFPPGGPPGETVKFRLLGDPAGELTQTVTLPGAVATGGPPVTALVNGLEFGRRAACSTECVELYPGGVDNQPPSPLPLRVSPLKNVLETSGSVTTATLPAALNGIIAKPFEEDVYRLTVKKGERYRVEVFGRSVGSPIDPRISIRRPDSETPEIEGDDTAIAASRFYSASGSIQRKELLDPGFVWEPKEDGEYLLSVTDMRGLGDPMSVYRVEVEPAHDAINTYLFARVIDSMQCPRLTATSVPRGNRWTVTFNLKEGLGNQYRGALELFATGLPKGVEMLVPPIAPGQSTVPVQFVAADDVAAQIALIDVQARPVDATKANRFSSRGQESFPFLSHSGGRAWHPVSVDQYVLAVTERAPFTIEVTQPRIPLIRNGSLDVDVRVVRHAGFTGAVEFQSEWIPAGISGSPAITIAPDQSEAVFTMTANSSAALGPSQIALVATTIDGIDSGAYTGVGRTRVSTPFFKFDVADPHIDLKSQPTAVRRGQRGQFVWKVEHRRAFEGIANAELLGLPKGVRTVGAAAKLAPQQAELAFEIEVAPDTLLGPYRELTCEVSLRENGQDIKQRLGRGVLRVDP
jgi:hypothetical protein